MSDKVPPVLDWVTARADCSLFAAFKQLASEVHEDVKTIQALQQSGDRRTFGYIPSGPRRFSVTREDEAFPMPMERSVDFTLEQNEIVVIGIDNQIAAKATVTLTADGRCKLKVDGNELEHWEFRKLVLERIFFGALKN